MATTAEGEIQKLKALEDRIKAPCVWGRAPCGLRFEDLQDRRYDDAVKLLKKEFLNEEVTYRSVNITDPANLEALEEFVHNARVWMRDKVSLAAVKEKDDTLAGVLLMRIQEKASFSRTFSRVKMTYDPIYTSVMTFYNEVERPVDLFDKLQVRRYSKVYVLALKNRYRHRGIGKLMLKAAIELTKSAGVPAAAGIFTTGRGQAIADQLGFQKFNEVYYSRYLVDDKIVFADTGVGNYSAALMAYRIPEVEEAEELMRGMSSRYTVQGEENAEEEGGDGESIKDDGGGDGSKVIQ
ncbi:uncharacterized protein LOC105394365 [Plutella xylostella]|uniref:uncharacterized protein LOC105394365 n=1 Tax=Plutella xylostella TaxID=51655 RepID=UPI0020325B45|nr:uncharacterized protein LOC105394365 [Plutella xylostella]